MIKFLIFVVLVGAAAYYFPQIREEVGGPCQALEKKSFRDVTDKGSANSVIAGLTLTLTDGNLGRKIAEDAYPDIPAPFSCVATYYFPKD